MKRVLAALRALVIAAAWAVALVLGGLLALEETGLLTDLVRDAVARRLGPLGSTFSIERARLRWLEPGIELQGVVFEGSPSPDGVWAHGPERVRLTRVLALLDPATLRIERVEVRGGRVVLGPALAAAARALPRRERPAAPASAPSIHVLGLALHLELEGEPALELGSVDLVAAPGEDALHLDGRVWPTLAGAVVGPAPVLVEGVLRPDGALVATASTRGLGIDVLASEESALLRRAAAERLGAHELAAAGEVTLRAEVRVPGAAAAEEGGSRVEATLRLALREGELAGRLALPARDGRERDPLPLDLAELELDLEARADAPAASAGLGLAPLARADAWRAAARAEARWNRSDVLAAALLDGSGTGGTLLDAWARADDVPVDRASLAALAAERWALDDLEALGARGTADVAARLRLPRGAGGRGWTRRLEVAAEVACDESASLAWRGWADARGARRGVPLPLEDVEGLLVWQRRPSSAPHQRLALVDVRARAGAGRVGASGSFATPPRAPGERGPALAGELRIEGSEIAIDDALLAALDENPGTSWVRADLAPEGGTGGFAWRVSTGARRREGASSGRIELEGVRLRWSGAPVPLRGDAEIEVRTARGATGVAWSFASASDEPRRVEARGLHRGERAPAPDAPRPAPLQEVSVRVDGLLLRGDDWDALARALPALARAADELRPQGRADVLFRSRRALPGGALAWSAETTAREVALTPAFFRRQAQDVRGRLIAFGREARDGAPAEAGARFALAAAWPGDVALAAEGALAAAGAGGVRLHAAGVDPANPATVGSLLHALESEEGGGRGALDLSEFAVEGRLDVRATVLLEDGEPVTRTLLYLRDERLVSRDVRLDSMSGVLALEGRVLRSPRLRARLAGTPVELTDVLLARVADARALADADPLLRDEAFAPESAFALQADWSAPGVPLDRAHLEALLDAPTVDVLLGRMGLLGALEVDDARIVAVGSSDGRGRVAFSGRVTPRDLRLTAGVPIAVPRADVQVERLLLEAGVVRGWWRVLDLEGRVAGRRVRGARMLGTLVDGRLAVTDLAGEFEGGRVRTLPGGEHPEEALVVDLRPPYGFALALRLDDVPVERVVGGLFDTGGQDLGRFDARLRLQGRGSDVLALAGAGDFDVRDARLWTIPVVREILATLGLDSTVTFDRLKVSYALEDARIVLREVSVRSPLLRLVGNGVLGLDGRVRLDLQVRYGIVDMLGPMSRVLYWLNNSLFRLAVRGDAARPRVVVRSALRELFRGFDEDPPRELPLPAWWELPARF